MSGSHVTFSKIFQAFSETSFEEGGIHVLTKSAEAELFIQSDIELVSGIQTGPITITEIPTTLESHELGRFQMFLADFISNKVLNMERPHGQDRGRLVKDVCKILREGGEALGYPILWIENRSGEGFTIIPSQVPEYN
tara:strand:+ start:70 stop:483 length:414 start_codon:yes stop_codon:yes gene_type:complete